MNSEEMGMIFWLILMNKLQMKLKPETKIISMKKTKKIEKKIKRKEVIMKKKKK